MAGLDPKVLQGMGTLLPAGFPLGLCGMMDGGTEITMSKHKFDDYTCGAVPCESLTDHEDKVSFVVRTFHADELHLLYKTLYQLGYRESQSAAGVSRLRDRYVPKVRSKTP